MRWVEEVFPSLEVPLFHSGNELTCQIIIEDLSNEVGRGGVLFFWSCSLP